LHDGYFSPAASLCYGAGLETFSSSPDQILERVDCVLASFRKICISSVSRPTGEWKDTDYDVVGEGVPVGRIPTMSVANFSLD
jgi:hypothetical protein